MRSSLRMLDRYLSSVDLEDKRMLSPEMRRCPNKRACGRLGCDKRLCGEMEFPCLASHWMTNLYVLFDVVMMISYKIDTDNSGILFLCRRYCCVLTRICAPALDTCLVHANIVVL